MVDFQPLWISWWRILRASWLLIISSSFRRQRLGHEFSPENQPLSLCVIVCVCVCVCVCVAFKGALHSPVLDGILSTPCLVARLTPVLQLCSPNLRGHQHNGKYRSRRNVQTSAQHTRTCFRTLYSCHILKYYWLRKCVTIRKWVLFK